ncbi:hypothetical protein, partial [Aeromicrobium sp.]|uniref:hypothetical protein n=1 Tax=Aeromicrobium sp. TaxID=1871063 RepID=UPI0019A4FDD2
MTALVLSVPLTGAFIGTAHADTNPSAAQGPESNEAPNLVAPSPVGEPNVDVEGGGEGNDRSQTGQRDDRIEDEGKVQSGERIPGDNGTVKIHQTGTPVEDRRNEPKVCGFYLDAFSFDAGQPLTYEIVPGPNFKAASVLSGTISTDALGDGHTAALSLPNGMYKLTVTFPGEHGAGKHKVFKVDCPTTTPPAPPTVPTVPAPVVVVGPVVVVPSVPVVPVVVVPTVPVVPVVVVPTVPVVPVVVVPTVPVVP